MPFEIVRNDIVNMQVDAIVNTANPRPEVGSGTDSRIHQMAGPALLEARRQIGDIARGDAAITPAGNLPAKYVIHTVGPRWWDGGRREELLRRCYDRSLELALAHGCTSIAFPLISSGYYGFPKDLALQIAISAFSCFLTRYEMQIYLVVYDGESYKLSENLFRHVASFIDEHYVQTVTPRKCCTSGGVERGTGAPFRANVTEEAIEIKSAGRMSIEGVMPCAPCTSTRQSLEELLQKTDAGFTETLLKLIDKTGKKDSDIYKKANLSKQHFSKIRNNPAYRPTKATAIALAIALELDLPQTMDLIGRAGYAFTDSSKFDLIIRYFIQNGNYNVVEINIALYEFDQPLLGA